MSVLSDLRFHDEQAAYDWVEAQLWPTGPICPHCGSVERISKMGGKSTRIGTYKCYACRKPFTVKIGTVFESSHVPMRVWLQAIYLFCSSKKGISTRQLQRTFQCGMKTAWFLGHRVREAMTELGIPVGGPLGGQNKVVEADETYGGGKARNRKGKIPPKTAVLALVEREGKVRSFHLHSEHVTAQMLKPIIVSQVNKASYLMTDEALVYPKIGDEFAGHGTVNHSAEEYVRAHFWHTNTVENYFSILKRGIVGIYHHVSETHLHRYSAEFDFRYNHRVALGYTDMQRTEIAAAGIYGKRLTYRRTSQQPITQASFDPP